MKKTVLLLLIAAMLLGLFAGCDWSSVTTTLPPMTMDEPYIAFRADKPLEFALDGFTQVDAAVFDSYTSAYADYSGTTYFDTLSAGEQKLYRILQYAMDHAYPCILIDQRVLEDAQSGVEDILRLFSLDSAVVEQNLAWEYSEFTVTTTYENLFSGDRVEELKGLQLYISDFSREKQDKKQQAIEKAQQILSAMPADLTQTEQAKYFYTYLGQNVEYHLSEHREEDADYLYDALIDGKTNCDGYANAFSLLCSMSGIPCLEKIYIPADGSSGHTWNAARLDGVWYNVDATASDEVNADFVILTHFGFSDALLEYDCAYTQRLPVCETELIPADCTVTDTDAAGEMIRSAFSDTDRDYVIALFPGGPVEQEVLQQIADTLNAGITSRHYTATNGMAVYYIYLT